MAKRWLMLMLRVAQFPGTGRSFFAGGADGGLESPAEEKEEENENDNEEEEEE